MGQFVPKFVFAGEKRPYGDQQTPEGVGSETTK
jgi:hypothetical protein